MTEKDLRHWRMLAVFQEALEAASAQTQLHRTFADQRRQLGLASYLSLFLFGLFNPVVESMRGLCAITELKKVQQTIGCGKVSLGSFSEAQACVEPELLHEVFDRLYHQVRSGVKLDPRLKPLNIVIQDGSLWRALPRMAWAEYGVGPKGEAKGVRLHLRFHLADHKPFNARVTRGSYCERKALRQMCVPNQTNVGDRHYGEDYQLFKEVDQSGACFVFRLKDNAAVQVEEQLALTEADKAQGVQRHVWARLGINTKSMRVRLVEIKTTDQHLLLATNLPAEKAPAELISQIYRHRWAIELFFRWIKCILGCRHFFAESPQGVALQLYLALIAALLFQLYTGKRPSKRMMEFIQMYQLGWASAEELQVLLAKEIKKLEKS